VLKEIREKEGITKIGIQGYCYGGKIAVVFGGQPDKVSIFTIDF
jgi:dienelactone hydrolase